MNKLTRMIKLKTIKKIGSKKAISKINQTNNIPTNARKSQIHYTSPT
ncbi:hypothetical protein QQG21_12010 [Staphylococcus aureus]|nr:hypothetical protein QQG21_12010 [Staphylococcus aureus]WKD13974.1 hypothetical protein QQG25_03705 [Staphylococcus aureus]